jgi:uncharacterized cofD-like protein
MVGIADPGAIVRLSAFAKLFRPGLRVKRWLALMLAGLALALLGLALLMNGRTLDLLGAASHFWRWLADSGRIRWGSSASLGLGIGLTVAGALAIVVGASKLMSSLSSAIAPAGSPAQLVDAVYRSRTLSLGPRVVVIGGGTGLSTMLRGLKQYTSNIVAIVTVTDDGGSSGKLQRQLSILPPGDIRNCLVALADSEGTMTDLLQYRFRGQGIGEGLRDHAFGNLFIAAMCDIAGGDFEEAVRRTSRVLNIRGRVLPSTLKRVSLVAEMEDGSTVEGETNIVHSPLRIRRVALNPADAEAPEEVIEAIRLADIIVVGPGSIYTSVVPNLLVHGIPEAIYRSPAKKVFICNVMTQPGESDGFTASDHLRAIEAHVRRPVVQYVVVNTGTPSLELLDKYRQTGATLVEPDIDRVRKMGYRTLPGNYVSLTDVVRHDPARLAEAILRLIL